MPPEIVEILNRIRAVYTKHGFDLFKPLGELPPLNEYHPSPKSLGDYYFIMTNERNFFGGFCCPQGFHQALGNYSCGGGEKVNKAAFEELSETFNLTLVEEEDNYNFTTYKGCRTRYYRIGS